MTRFLRALWYSLPMNDRRVTSDLRLRIVALDKKHGELFYPLWQAGLLEVERREDADPAFLHRRDMTSWFAIYKAGYARDFTRPEAHKHNG